MPSLSLVGPSYTLRQNVADNERTINWVPALVESGNGKAGQNGYLKQHPGLTQVADFSGASIRGVFAEADSLFVVAGAGLWEVSSAWAKTSLGTLSTSSGVVEAVSNNTQIGMVDGLDLYVLDIGTKSIAISPANWRLSSSCGYLDGYGVFIEDGSNQFFLSGPQDLTSFDALDFASAEGSVGDLVGIVVNRRDVYLFKTQACEVWGDVGGADFPFARNDAANIETGCCAAHTIRKLGGSVYWMGRDKDGAAVMFGTSAYQPQRISSVALEEALMSLDDVSGAYAFTAQVEGQLAYYLQVPGLSSTWRYDVAAGIWTEVADFVDGEFAQWRGTCHAYAYGKHVIGGSDGRLYVMDAGNKFGTDPMVRERITPNSAMPSLTRQRYGSIQIDCQTGRGLSSGFSGTLMLSYSDDAGETWSNWRRLPLGVIGNYLARARATMLGASRMRTWRIRVTDDVRVDLLAAVVNEV